MPVKLFDRWPTEGVEVTDLGLRNYINLKPVVIPRTYGRESSQQFHKSHMSIVERFANHIYVSGHRGKKHMITSGKNVGKTFNAWRRRLERIQSKSSSRLSRTPPYARR